MFVWEILIHQQTEKALKGDQRACNQVLAKLGPDVPIQPSRPNTRHNIVVEFVEPTNERNLRHKAEAERRRRPLPKK
jgi:hypothetical protein